MAVGDDLAEVLTKYWGFDTFLPLQAEAMGCAVEGRDSVVVLPTGGGKSLCFQAPAMCLDGVAVVVSPLIALMKDQVDALRNCGVPAAYANSTSTTSERREVADLVRAGRLRLLYMSPERLLAGRTLNFLKAAHVSLIAIDEAHCISSWGHDFRPEYRQLGLLKEAFPHVGIHAYTATASEKVRRDIAKQLKLTNPNFLVGSFDRPNLVYQVQRRHDRLGQVCEVLDRHRGESGIIYSISRKDVEQMSAALTELGYRALPYHAGLTDLDRLRSQEAFLGEKIDTMVATVAFGMGIDKSNVRYVVHAGMPKSLEQYQQESGRAGRDGLEAECCLFYSGQDFRIWKNVVQESEPEVREGAVRSLAAMMDFCTGVQCRHQALVEYFGQQLPDRACGACDVCLGQLDLVDDSLVVGQKVLSCVARLRERFGGDYTAKVLCGSKDKRVLQQNHDELSTWGLLADDGIRAVRDWIEQLVSQAFLAKVGDFNLLQITDRGRQLLRGEVTPRLLRPADISNPAKLKAASDSWEGVDRGLFDALRQLRKEIAAAKRVPAYIVFGDASLRDMSRRRPSTLASFPGIQGVGDQKLAEFGTLFVERIVDYCRANDLRLDVQPAAAVAQVRSAKPSVNLSAVKAYPLFRTGQSVEEIANTLSRATSTVYGYLDQFIRHEKITDPSPWVDAVTVQRIAQAAEQVGTLRLKPIYEFLGNEVSYEQIRIVIGCKENARTET